jgi:ABC-type oligopeptide transport system substrate-binding subunit
VKMSILVAALMVGLVSSGVVCAESSIALANQLGTVLAAESACHLSYDPKAIQNYISKNVPESDMSFGSLLEIMVQGQTTQIAQMTSATLTALCAQTERVARFNGFIH